MKSELSCANSLYLSPDYLIGWKENWLWSIVSWDDFVEVDLRRSSGGILYSGTSLSLPLQRNNDSEGNGMMDLKIPASHSLCLSQFQNMESYSRVRSIKLRRLSVDDPFGFTVRGGQEHGTGIFVSSVTPKSIAHKQGLKVRPLIY